MLEEVRGGREIWMRKISNRDISAYENNLLRHKEPCCRCEMVDIGWENIHK